MTDARRPRVLAAASLIAVLLGVVLFGAVQGQFRLLLAGLLLAAAGGLLLALPRSERPGRWWFVAALAFPAWLGLQLVPVPAPLLGLFSPAAASRVQEFWPGPLHGCEGQLLVPATPGWRPLSLDPVGGREFALQVLAGMVLFLAVRAYFRRADDDDRDLLLGVVSAFTTAEAVYAVVQWLAASPSILWVAKTAYLDSATGTLVNRNHFALLMYVGLGCTLVLLRRRADLFEEPPPGERARETAIRATLALAAALQLAGILASKSRAGLVGAALVLLTLAPGVVRARRGVQALAVVLALAVIVPTLLVVGPDITARFRNIAAEWSDPGSRGGVLRLSSAYARDFLLTGSGGASFEYVFPQYRTAKVAGTYDFAHDDYLQVLLETGLPGLAFALLPIGLYAAQLVRWRRRARRAVGDAEPDDELLDLGTRWPLYAALAAVALHEFVDFGLQIPALAFLVAFLAGAFAPPVRAEKVSRGLVLAGAAVALALALPAALHGVARWPVIGATLPFPDLPDTRHGAVAEALTAWRADQKNIAPVCDGILDGARSLALRPLASRYCVDHAQLLVAAADRPGAPDGNQKLQRAEASRAIDRARRMDPWDAWNRERIMDVSLALGELDRAAEDAVAVTQASPGQAASVVQTLLQIGLPPDSIVRIAQGDVALFRGVVRAVLEQQDYATAGALIPPDVRADAVRCQCGWMVMDILRNRHHVAAAPFLNACLALPVGDDAKIELNAALAADLMIDGQLDRAGVVIRRLQEGGNARAWAELELAERRKQWADVALRGESLLHGPDPLSSDAEGWLRYRVARAYANEGQVKEALRNLRAARDANPSIGDIDRMVRELELGDNPFR